MRAKRAIVLSLVALFVAVNLFAQSISASILETTITNILETSGTTIIPGGSQGAPPSAGDWVFDAPLTEDVTDDYSGVAGTVVWGGNGTYVDASTGWINNASVDEARFEEWGLLREGGRTNEVEFSCQYERWTKIEILFDDSNSTSPDNGNYGRGIIATDDYDFHRMYKFVEGQFCGNATTFSFYAKNGTWSWIRARLLAYNGTSYVGSKFAYFDVENGTIGSTSIDETLGDSYKITEMNDGWRRYEITYGNPPEATVKVLPDILVTHSDDIDKTTGDNNTVAVYLYGAQVEIGPYASSFIYVDSWGDVSRATEAGLAVDDNGLSWTFADLDSDVSDALSAGGEGTLLLDFHPISCFDCVDNGTAYNLVSVNDSVNSTLYLWKNYSGADCKVASFDGTNVANVDCSWYADANYTMAVRWGDGTFQVGVKNATAWAWGTEKAYDGSFDIGTKLRLSYENEDVHWHAKNFKIRNEKLSTAEIEAL